MPNTARSDGASCGESSRAYLEHYPEQGGNLERIPLAVLPFTVGRAETNDQRMPVSGVSRTHAVFQPHADGYCLRDLDSTNGTFVNGVKIAEQVLKDGDILHFGPLEFCFRTTQNAIEPDASSLTVLATRAMPRLVPHSVIRGTERLRELIDTQAVDIVYQPIVDLRTRQIVAFEALARGRHPALSSSPMGLIRLAEECGMAVELSQLLRRLAVMQAARLTPGTHLFLNMHPRELDDSNLLPSLEELRSLQPPGRTLVLEIAESSVTNVKAMTQIRDAFTKLDFQFAYDDFGAGQARLLELTDIPPHFLKLDLGVITGIEDQLPRQQVVRALLGVVGTLGVQVIAEGIETEPCAATCLAVGCHLGQGYLFGRPEPPLARDETAVGGF